MSAAANLPEWIEPAPAARPRRMQVSVTTDVGRRVQYEALFRSTFDAYDDAIERHPHCARVEVKPLSQEASHARR